MILSRSFRADELEPAQNHRLVGDVSHTKGGENFDSAILAGVSLFPGHLLAMPSEITFDLPHPHLLEVQVSAGDIDAYQHVNNAVYVTWCDRVAWSHSTALGLSLNRCLELDRGMAVLRTVIRYLRPALRDDMVTLATWLLPAKSKLCVNRRFQLVRASDGVTLVRAEIEYACIELSSGRPARWPLEFRDRYCVLPEVDSALIDLAPI